MAMSRYYTEEIPRFSRRWWLQTGRNTFWIFVITVLIWVFADLEFTDDEELRATIRMTIGNSKDLVLLDRNDAQKRDVNVTFQVQGSRGSLNNYVQELQKARKGGAVIEYDLTKAHGKGKHPISVVDLLRQTEAITKGGLTVIEATPAMISIELDEALYVPDIEVNFNYTGAVLPKVDITPSKMGIRVSSKLWAEVDPGSKLQTVSVDLRNRPDETISVQIQPAIAGIPVIPDHKEVTVAVKVGQLTGEKSMKVTVRLLAPSIWSEAEDGTWQRFVLKRKEPTWHVEIRVEGPKTVIESLKPEHVDAYIRLTDDHKKTPESWDTAKVQIRFTPQFKNVKLVGEPPSVSFKLIPKPAAVPAP